MMNDMHRMTWNVKQISLGYKKIGLNCHRAKYWRSLQESSLSRGFGLRAVRVFCRFQAPQRSRFRSFFLSKSPQQRRFSERKSRLSFPNETLEQVPRMVNFFVLQLV